MFVQKNKKCERFMQTAEMTRQPSTFLQQYPLTGSSSIMFQRSRNLLTSYTFLLIQMLSTCYQHLIGPAGQGWSHQLVLSVGPSWSYQLVSAGLSWSSPPALKAEVLHLYSEILSDGKAVLMFMHSFFITTSKLKYFNKKIFFL